jgi:putative transposase
MGRAWRIEYEGALYHILSRSNEQKDIFYDDQDLFAFDAPFLLYSPQSA